MYKKELIKKIENLNEDSFQKFADIAEKVLSLLDHKNNELISNLGMIDTTEEYLPVSEKLKKARKEKGLSQIELAKRLNLSRGQIGNIEANIRPASKEIAKKLSRYFNTDIGYWIK